MNQRPDNLKEQGIYTVIVSFILILFVLLFVFFFDGVQNSSLDKQASAITSEALQSGIKTVQDTAVLYANLYNENYAAAERMGNSSSYVIPCWGYLPLPTDRNANKNPFAYLDNYERAAIFGISVTDTKTPQAFESSNPDACTTIPDVAKYSRAFARVTPGCDLFTCPKYRYEPITFSYTPQAVICNPSEVIINCVTRVMSKNVNTNLQEKVTENASNQTVRSFWADIQNNGSGNQVIDDISTSGRTWNDFDCDANTGIPSIINLRVSLKGSFTPLFKSPYEASASTKTVTANSVGSVNLCPPR